MRIFNSIIVPKNVKGGPLGFSTSIQVQNTKKIEGGPFEDFKKFRKKSHKAEKVAGKVS